MWTIGKLARYVDEAYGCGHFPPTRVLLTRHKIFAYYGFLGDRNFGDELTFQAAKKLFEPDVLLLIKRRMPIHFAIWSRIRKQRFDGIVIGGGTLVTRPFYARTFFLDLVRRGKPIYVHGTGIDARYTWDSGWGEVLKQRIWGGVRGPLSMCNAKEFGEKLHLVGDAAFLLFRRPDLPESAVRGNTVLINLGTHLPFDNQTASRNAVEQFVAGVIAQGFEVKFLPFHGNDLKLGHELAKRHASIAVLSIPKSYEEAERHFRNCVFALGERLHFAVMAILTRCPFFSVKYAEKHDDILTSVGLQGAGCTPREVTVARIRAAFEARACFDWADAFERIEQFQERQREEARAFHGAAVSHSRMPKNRTIQPSDGLLETEAATHSGPDGVANPLDPSRTLFSPAWIRSKWGFRRKTSVPLAETARRRRKIADGETDRERWSDHRQLAESWDARARQAGLLIPPGSVVIDLGCGRMALQRFLPADCRYIPCDLVSRDQRTVVCDFNAGSFPDAEAASADVVAVLGVLEYIFDPHAFLFHLRQWQRPVVLSYCATEAVGNREHRRDFGWVNDLSTGTLRKLFEETGFSVARSDRIDRMQWLFLLKPVSSLAPAVKPLGEPLLQ